jgi:hypothetical protein
MPLTVSDIARRLGVRPRDVSELFYNRKVKDDDCPIMAGRRLIPESYVDVIAMALRRGGKLSTKGNDNEHANH